MAPPAPANTQPDAGSLNGIIQGRLAARRERIEAERMETVRKTEDGGSLREVMGRFPGPFSRQQSQSDGNADTFRPSENPGPLRSAVAEIVERQRKLDEPARPASDIGEMRQHRLDEPVRPVSDINETLERAFQKLSEQFEQRAARTFDSLEVSLAEVTRLITESPQPRARC